MPDVVSPEEFIGVQQVALNQGVYFGLTACFGGRKAVLSGGGKRWAFEVA